MIFDGPPSHESGRFVEVENERGESVKVGEWRRLPDGLWSLGPLYAAPIAQTADARDAARWRAFRELVKSDHLRAQGLVWDSKPSRKRFDALVDAVIAAIQRERGKP